MLKRPYVVGLMLGGMLVIGQLLSSNAKADPAPAAQAHLPQVTGPIPVTPTSHPFLTAGESLAQVGYVEEEYFLSGDAYTYDWTGPGHAVKAIAGPAKYVTRILVRRPEDAARFSGNVEVTILNASLGVDFGGPIDFARAVKQGDVWIGITTKPLAANALKKFDPARYAPLDWKNPGDPASRCAVPTIIPRYMIGNKEVVAMAAKMGMLGSSPDTEDGLVWDMLGQLGLLLKSEHRHAILPGFGQPKVYMTGVSQSALYIRTWIAGFHDRYRTSAGRPVYDGYLGVVGPALLRINQCAEDIPLDDPRQKLDPIDVPFISVSSEGEMWQARYTHQPNAFTAQGGMVSYEVAGASHAAADISGSPAERAGMASPEDIAKSGVKMLTPEMVAGMLPDGATPNDFVWEPIIRGAYHNLQLWVRQDIRPPEAPGIEIDANLQIKRDANGNALGGLRTPYIEAPLSAHRGYLTAGGMGGVMGTRKPLPPAVLAAMYPDHAAYVAKFSAATQRLLAGRWISADDAAEMKRAAQAATIPPVGATSGH